MYLLNDNQTNSVSGGSIYHLEDGTIVWNRMPMIGQTQEQIQFEATLISFFEEQGAHILIVY